MQWEKVSHGRQRPWRPAESDPAYAWWRDKGRKKIKISKSMWYTSNLNSLEEKHGTDG
jgi:hypothetical protein